MDRLTPAERSKNMSAIKAKNTSPEIYVRKLLFSAGFRFRLHDKSLPGTPDIVLKKFKTVVFVHGCFWHGHENCKKAKMPETNSVFWIKKINQNKSRDQKVVKELIDLDFKVIVIWECACKKSKKDELLSKIVTCITEREGCLFVIGSDDFSDIS